MFDLIDDSDDLVFFTVNFPVKLRELTEFGLDEKWKAIYVHHPNNNQIIFLGIQGIINVFATAGWELAFKPDIVNLISLGGNDNFLTFRKLN